MNTLILARLCANNPPRQKSFSEAFNRGKEAFPGGACPYSGKKKYYWEAGYMVAGGQI